MVSQPVSPPRPDLKAYRESLHLEFPKLVQGLVEILGKKLVAYIASVKDVRAIDRWIAGAEPYRGNQERLRLAYHVAGMLRDHDSKNVVQAWLIGVNPELNDRVPIRLLREE